MKKFESSNFKTGHIQKIIFWDKLSHMNRNFQLFMILKSFPNKNGHIPFKIRVQ